MEASEIHSCIMDEQIMSKMLRNEFYKEQYKITPDSCAGLNHILIGIP